MLPHKLAHETICSYAIFDWFNKLYSIPFDQSAGCSQIYTRGFQAIGRNSNLGHNTFDWLNGILHYTTVQKLEMFLSLSTFYAFK